jgi:2-polyprenyl-3-methyl-5-hydroxy-6-metoxy-1,4-benzoquinol methylase
VNALEEARGRAQLSGGMSHAAIYRMVRRALAGRRPGGVVVDVGCGGGHLHGELGGLFDRYVGIDLISYPGAPSEARRVLADLERPLPLADEVADVAIAVETIEHLENPRALVRELARVARPGGFVVITTPNQLSALSLLTLIARRRFAAFQDVHYPAHRTALLETDLRRIVAEAGLAEPHVLFSEYSRVPLTAWTYPRWIARRSPALLSDNVLIAARKPQVVRL